MTHKPELASAFPCSCSSQETACQRDPSGVQISQEAQSHPGAAQAPEASHCLWPAVELDAASFESRRCSEKGCVFPAAENPRGTCLHHEHLHREPGHFHSYQPSMSVINQARFGLPDYETDNRRAQDRRRLAAQREAFWEGLA